MTFWRHRLLTLAFTGFVILMAHPRLYWGEVGNDLTPALLELAISHAPPGIRGSETPKKGSKVDREGGKWMYFNFKALIASVVGLALLVLALRYVPLADAVGGLVIAIAVVVATLVSVIELSGPASNGLWRRLRLRRRPRSPFP
jgi:hypothetical protein